MKPAKNSRLLRKGRVSIPGQKYFVTTTTLHRTPVFSDPAVARLVLDTLHWLNARQALVLDAAVVMPDHVHAVFELRHGTVGRVMHSFKRHAAREINRTLNREGSLWQAQYHDHALRRDEDERTMVQYLLNNPVRAGLVENVRDYPHWWCRWEV